MSKNLTGQPQILKIIIIGMSGIGKTSFLTRYTDDTFSQSYIVINIHFTYIIL